MKYARKRMNELVEDSYKTPYELTECLAITMGIEYLFEMPDAIPEEMVLVHNRVRHQPVLGQNGLPGLAPRPLSRT